MLSAIKEAVMPLLTETEAKGASFRIELYALQHWNDIRNSVAGLTPEMISKVDLFLQRFTVFGLDLSHTPNFKVFDVYWAIPIITGVLSLAMSVYSLMRQKKVKPGNVKKSDNGLHDAFHTCHADLLCLHFPDCCRHICNYVYRCFLCADGGSQYNPQSAEGSRKANG